MIAESIACIALAVYHESRGEPLEGQMAVAEVILRRTKASRWPDDPCDVVYQDWQFSWTRLGDLTPDDEKAYNQALGVAMAAKLLPTGEGAVTRCADHFHSQMERLPRFAQTYRLEKKIGGHWFYCSNSI